MLTPGAGAPTKANHHFPYYSAHKKQGVETGLEETGCSPCQQCLAPPAAVEQMLLLKKTGRLRRTHGFTLRVAYYDTGSGLLDRVDSGRK